MSEKKKQIRDKDLDNSNTTVDMTKQGVMNHAPTNTTERQRRASALEKQIDEMVRHTGAASTRPHTGRDCDCGGDGVT